MSTLPLTIPVKGSDGLIYNITPPGLSAPGVVATNLIGVQGGGPTAVAMPVTAAALPLPTGAASDATLTGGTAKAIARGGAKGTTTAADVTSTASGANHNCIDVVIYDTAGNPITTFGGGGSGGSVVVTSSALPTGAATSANQTPVTNAGTAAATAAAFQGVPGGVPVEVKATTPLAIAATSIRGTITPAATKTISGTTVQTLILARTTEVGSRTIQVLTGSIWCTFDGTTPTSGGGYPMSAGDARTFDRNSKVPWELFQCVNDTSTSSSTVYVEEIV